MPLADSLSTVASPLDTAANWASIAGLALSVVGITLTYLQARGAQSAANAAKAAVDSVRDQIQAIDAIERLATCSRIIEEIKRYARAQEWERVPELCSLARKPLVEIEAGARDLSEQHRKDITAAAGELRNIEDIVARHIANRASRLDPPRIQRTLSGLQDSLTAALAMRRRGGINQP